MSRIFGIVVAPLVVPLEILLVFWILEKGAEEINEGLRIIHEFAVIAPGPDFCIRTLHDPGCDRGVGCTTQKK